MDGLDGFARSFAEALFGAVPDLRAHARTENGELWVELDPGPARKDCKFWISTEGDEVTVGFGMFHMHFDWPVRDGWQSDPIRFIQSMMADETLIEDWTLDGKWAGSSTLAATAEPDLRSLGPGRILHIRSWSGARDRTIGER